MGLYLLPGKMCDIQIEKLCLCEMKDDRGELSGVNMTGDRVLSKWRLATYDYISAEATVSKEKET